VQQSIRRNKMSTYLQPQSDPQEQVPQISLCAIVKNEAHCLSSMLLSVKDLVSEMIIVDTGSSDNTQEIAKSHGARVESFAWGDDFSAARNFSLSLATKEWILVLDADECLDADSIPLLKKLITGERSAYSVNRRHYVLPSFPGDMTLLPDNHPARELGAVGYFTTHDIRLLPRDARVMFSGAVHESVEDAVYRAGMAFPLVEIVVHHYGHLESAEERTKKAEMYLTLAEKKAHGAPLDWRAWFQLGVEYQGLGRDSEAATSFQTALQQYDEFAPGWRQLGLSLCRMGDTLSGLSALQKAFKLDQTCLITWCALGEALIVVGDLQGAEHCFNTILHYAPAHTVALKRLAEIAQSKAG
jgi:tetratricopeptide (TPR) repeat protein